MKCVYNHLFYEWDLIFSCLETIHWVILGHGPYINGLIGQKRNMYYLALTRAEDISRVCATVPLFMKMWRSQFNVRSCKIQGEGLAIYKKKKKKLASWQTFLCMGPKIRHSLIRPVFNELTCSVGAIYIAHNCQTEFISWVAVYFDHEIGSLLK